MFQKFLIIICAFTFALSAQAQTTAKKKVKKTVTTTTEEVDENGKTVKKTEKVESTDDDGSEKSESAPTMQETSGLPTINESWYTLWGLGISKASYSGNLGDAYETDGDATGSDRSTTVNVDLLGFYWPLDGHKTMLGFIINGAGDTIKNGTTEESLYSYLFGFSVHHFFGENIGHGWFLRGDVGLAWTRVDIDAGTLTYNEASDKTLGAMFGGGYGFSLGKETRLLLGLYVRPIPKTEYNSGATVKGSVSNMTVGFLF